MILPLAACFAALAVGMAACLYLFLLAKHDVRAAEKRWARKQEAVQSELAATVEAMRAELVQFNERIRETEASAGMLVPPPPALSGLNLGKRSQALRLFRRGESPRQIAAALHIPEGEVQLLVKVHRIVLKAPGVDAANPVP